MFPMGQNSDLRIPLLLLREHFSKDMLSRVSWSSATTSATMLYPPKVVNMWTTRGHSLNRSTSFCIASALSISIRTIAAWSSSSLALIRAEILMMFLSLSLLTLFLAPMLEKPMIFASCL